MLALTAACIFALAPFVHGLIHPDHIVERALATAAAHSEFPVAPGHAATHSDGTCLLFQLCVTAGSLSSTPPSLVAPLGLGMYVGYVLVSAALIGTVIAELHNRGPPEAM